ncbi:hypothetical protein BAE44_0001374 [Dichanthelium oligosanthes]|uniref:Uncharacterized protein n=1 Tax=Dichanthelium oligosanthes TaxID=888268 RepID=A0A1E5WJN6_9POAL|nr:hypothetical protein BAE44_0001374 [Dichanthelium oligosanthes]
MKAVRSLMLLITYAWELWKQKNARIFERWYLSPRRLIKKIKQEGCTVVCCRGQTFT